MAVPSAVLKQRAKLEEELGINRDGTPVTPPADQTPAPVPPVVEPPAQPPTTPEPSSTAPDLAARVSELENLLRARDGQTSAATREANEARTRADTLALQVQTLEEAVADVTKQKGTLEAQLAGKTAATDMPDFDEPVDLTPEEREVFGADSVKFVEKMSKKELLRYIKPLVGRVAAMETQLARLPELDQLPQLKKVVTEAQQETSRNKEAEFFRVEVLKYFPDFEVTRETQEWKDYLATDIPGKGIKIGHQLHQYRLAHNAPGIRSIINGFYDAQNTKPSLASLAVPSKTSTEGTPSTKPKMKASEYKTKLREFINRKLEKPKWDAFKTAFNEALADGRVEMDDKL